MDAVHIHQMAWGLWTPGSGEGGLGGSTGLVKWGPQGTLAAACAADDAPAHSKAR